MNPIVAAVRSVVQAIVSLGVVALGNVLLSSLGVSIEVEAITQTVSLAAFGGLVWAFNALGAKYPVINKVLSLGMATGAAEYATPTPSE